MLRRAISSSLSRRLKVRTLKGLIGGHSRCEINKGYRFSSTRDLMDDRMDVDPGALTLPLSDVKAHGEYISNRDILILSYPNLTRVKNTA